MTRKRTILRGKPGTRVASQKMALQTDFQKKKSRFVAFYTCALFGRDHEPLAWNVAVCWTSFCDWKKSGRKCGKTISMLASYSVASDPKLGISGVLEGINTSLKRYVPKEWGVEPHLKVSNLTREHLRKVITAFI